MSYSYDRRSALVPVRTLAEFKKVMHSLESWALKLK
jgi:hypothetical protein